MEKEFDSTVELIKATINKIRPFIQRDGGDCLFDSYEDGIVYIQFLGACVGCSLISETLYRGIETIVMEEVPGVIGVRLKEDKEAVKASLDEIRKKNEPWIRK